MGCLHTLSALNWLFLVCVDHGGSLNKGTAVGGIYSRNTIGHYVVCSQAGLLHKKETIGIQVCFGVMLVQSIIKVKSCSCNIVFFFFFYSSKDFLQLSQVFQHGNNTDKQRHIAILVNKPAQWSVLQFKKYIHFIFILQIFNKKKKWLTQQFPQFIIKLCMYKIHPFFFSILSL